MRWSGWENLGPTLLGPEDSGAAPAALATRFLGGQFDIFRVSGTRIRHKNNGITTSATWDEAQFSDLGPVPMHGNRPSRLTACGLSAQEIHLAANQGGQPAIRSYDGHTWSAWAAIPGTLMDRPAIASRAPGKLQVVAWGHDGRYHSLYRYADGGTSNWTAVGEGRFISPPSLVATTRAQHALFGVGEDSAVWVNEWRPGWQGWRSLGGYVGGHAAAGEGVAVSSSGNLKSEVFFVDPDDQAIVWGQLDDGRWSGWEKLPSKSLIAPFAISRLPGSFDLFHYGTDGSIYRGQWK